MCYLHLWLQFWYVVLSVLFVTKRILHTKIKILEMLLYLTLEVAV